MAPPPGGQGLLASGVARTGPDASAPRSRPRDHWLADDGRDTTTSANTSFRVRSLEQTQQAARAVLDRCGISRVADVTDLDVVGIPVFHTVRPTAAPGLNTVTSGKGTTAQAARVSAMMESIERTWCEPYARTALKASYRDLRRSSTPALDPRRLVLRRGNTWTEDASLGWWPVTELDDDVTVLVPALAVFTPYPPEHGMFRSNTIGLAAGNSPGEALLHAVLEAVEQDCTAFGETLRGGFRIRPDSLPDELGGLVERFERADVAVNLYLYTNEIGVPTVFATTEDSRARDGMLINGGAGCHLDPLIAARRALCEAAQSRLAVIGGAREDIGAQAYRRHESYQTVREMFRAWSSSRRPWIEFDDIDSRSTHSTSGDLERVRCGLRRAGLPLLLAVELAPEDFPFSVTKVVIPGLEVFHQDKRRLGVRLHQELAAAGQAGGNR